MCNPSSEVSPELTGQVSHGKSQVEVRGGQGKEATVKVEAELKEMSYELGEQAALACENESASPLPLPLPPEYHPYRSTVSQQAEQAHAHVV